MKCLVLVASYVIPNKSVAMMFAHVRNKYYVSKGIDVTVLNFAAKEDYEVDGIKVITLQSYSAADKYDLLISHAPNLRNHYKFLRKYADNFQKLLFFFHGHEVLKINEMYPEPYAYMKQKSFLMKRFQDVYDSYKLSVWRKYFPKIANRAQFIFVSNFILERFKHYVKLNESDLCQNVNVIHNSVGPTFEKECYDANSEKFYDFITIRSNMDSSVYCMDLINELAVNNPELKFLVIGRGRYFEINQKASNIEWVNTVLSHEKLIEYMNQSKMGLMLTREDTQGVMSCELETFGIPLLTSDIEVCRDIFSGRSNVAFVDNGDMKIDLGKYLSEAVYNVEKDEKFLVKNTIEKEIQLMNSILE